MDQVLVYGDSLSWGIIPGTRRRFDFIQRWPGVVEAQLLAAGFNLRVVEDCLNGRRTVWEDPFKPGRSGVVGIGQRIEVNSPLLLVILFLGSNDFQSMHSASAWHSAQGIATLVSAIRNARLEPGMQKPEILVVAPPTIAKAMGAIAPKFEGAEHRSVGLAEAIKAVAVEKCCHYFDAGTVVATSKVDGVHLDEEQHRIFGEAIGTEVEKLLKAVSDR